MIEIYKLSNAADINDTGYEFPQIEEDWNGKDFWGKTSVNSTPLSGKIPFKVEFPGFTLKPGANLTDMLSASNTSRYLMVSERLIMLFQNFNIDDFQYFIEKVHTPTGAIDYYLLYLTTPRDDDFIDWEKSFFFDVNDPEKKVFSVIDAKDYYQSANGKVLKSERLVIKPNQPSFDLFRCRYFNGGNRFYVSTRLKGAMVNAKISGIRLDRLLCFRTEDID